MEMKFFGKLINKINNQIKPDLSICLGDLIEDIFVYEHDVNTFKCVWDKLNEINRPFYSVIRKS